MSAIEFQNAVLQMTPQEQEDLRDWLENLLEDRLEMTEEFKAKIAQGEAELSAGLGRVRKP